MEQQSNANYALDGKIMLASVILLFAAVLLILCFRICLRRRHHRSHHRRLPPAAAVKSGGLDSSVIKSIPTFTYVAAAGGVHQKLECAVCLSEFEIDDSARVLPKCHHAFHVDCIDLWFDSHSNCPLCRAPVEIEIPSAPPKLPEAAGLLMPEYCRIKPLDLVGIIVEMPTGKERFGDL